MENNNKGKFGEFVKKMYQTRVKIHKGDTAVVNLSILYAVPALVCAPHITVLGVVAAMVLGYRFSFSQMDEDFAAVTAVNLKKPVQNAPVAAKEEMKEAAKETAEELTAQLKADAEALAEKDIPTIQVPAQA